MTNLTPTDTDLLLNEILQKISNAKTKAEKVELLKKYRSPALVSILIWNYDESVESALPVGEVPYNKNDAPIGTEHTRLRNQFTVLYNFVKGGNDVLAQSKREMLFIQLLEGLSAPEAELLCLVKDKQLQTKYKLTRNAISEAYTDIVWGNRAKKKG